MWQIASLIKFKVLGINYDLVMFVRKLCKGHGNGVKGSPLWHTQKMKSTKRKVFTKFIENVY